MQRVDSQAILSERRGPSEGGLPGSARRAKQGAAAALVDSRTRGIVPGGECLCGEPPHFRRACQLDGAAFALKISLKWRYLEAVEDGSFSGRACARQTRLSQEKGEGV